MIEDPSCAIADSRFWGLERGYKVVTATVILSVHNLSAAHISR